MYKICTNSLYPKIFRFQKTEKTIDLSGKYLLFVYAPAFCQMAEN